MDLGCTSFDAQPTCTHMCHVPCAFCLVGTIRLLPDPELSLSNMVSTENAGLNPSLLSHVHTHYKYTIAHNYDITNTTPSHKTPEKQCKTRPYPQQKEGPHDNEGRRKKMGPELRMACSLGWNVSNSSDLER